MTNGQEFEFKGNRYQFDRYFQYAATSSQPHPPMLISARRWIKSKQKFSGVSLLIARASEVEG